MGGSGMGMGMGGSGGMGMGGSGSGSGSGMSGSMRGSEPRLIAEATLPEAAAMWSITPTSSTRITRPPRFSGSSQSSSSNADDLLTTVSPANRTPPSTPQTRKHSMPMGSGVGGMGGGGGMGGMEPRRSPATNINNSGSLLAPQSVVMTGGGLGYSARSSATTTTSTGTVQSTATTTSTITGNYGRGGTPTTAGTLSSSSGGGVGRGGDSRPVSVTLSPVSPHTSMATGISKQTSAADVTRGPDSMQRRTHNRTLSDPTELRSILGAPPMVPVPASSAQNRGHYSLLAANSHESINQLESEPSSDSSSVPSLGAHTSSSRAGGTLTGPGGVGIGAIGSGPLSSSLSASQHGAIRWQRGPLLGRGAYGRVYLALDQISGRQYAAKQINLEETTPKAIAALHNEIATLARFNHPNIVAYFGCEAGQGTLTVFMEYVTGGDISTLIKHFGALSLNVTRNYTRDILSGLAYLHNEGLVHRDIKGANVLLTAEGHAKLADFGMSVIQPAEKTRTLSLVGSPYWMAPEVVQGRTARMHSDIWSLGATVWEMTAGAPFLAEKEPLAAIFSIGNLKALPELPRILDDVGRSFIRQTMAIRDTDRPTAAVLLTHEFVTGQRS